jgi:hypothetical protein
MGAVQATEGHGYLEAMRKFKSRTLVAALEGDHAVPVGAASIRWSCRYAARRPPPAAWSSSGIHRNPGTRPTVHGAGAGFVNIIVETKSRG